MNEQKPSPLAEEEVVGLVQQLVADVQFAERNAEYAARRDRLYGRTKVSIPGLLNLQTQYRWPRLRKDANRFKNTMLAAPLTYTVAANSDGPRAAAQAQDMQNFAKRHYVKWVAEGCFDGALFDMAAIGYGVLHAYVNRDVLPLMPDMDDDADPEAWINDQADILKRFASGERSDLLCVESVLPETVYWTPDMTVRLQAARVPINTFAAQYAGKWEIGADEDENVICAPVKSTSGGLPIDGGRTVTNRSIVVYIVEDANYIYHVVFGAQSAIIGAGGLTIPQLDAGTLLGVFSNPFGAPAFHLLDGERTGDPHALYRSLPLIDGLYEVGPMVNMMATLIESGAIEAAQNMKIIQALPGAEAAAARANTPLALNSMNDGFYVVSDGWGVTETPVRLPPDILNAYQTMQKEADQYGFPTALAQPQEITATSGYDRAKAQDAVSNLMNPPLEHFGEVCDALFTGLFSAVKNIGIPVSIRTLKPSTKLGVISGDVARAITLEPDSITDIDSNVKFDSTTSYAQIANQEEGLKMLDAKAMSLDDFLGNVRGIDDVNEYYRGMSVSDLRTVARAAAIQDATQAFEKIRAFAQQEAIAASNLAPPVDELAQQAMGGQAPPAVSAATPPPAAGPSIPTGPGSAMPLQPTPPQGGLT